MAFVMISFLVTSILNGSGKMMPLFRINRFLVWSCPYIQRISCITAVIHGGKKTHFWGEAGDTSPPSYFVQLGYRRPIQSGPLPVISRVITPISRVVTPFSHLYGHL